MKACKVIIKAVFSFFFLMLIVACASTKNASNKRIGRPVYITNTKKIWLLPPQSASQTVEALQLFSGSFGQSNFSLLSYTQIDGNGIQLLLFNEFGTDMGALNYDDKEISFYSSFFPEKLPAEYILAEIQNVYYKFEELSENYADSGLTFERSFYENTSEKEVRRLWDGKTLIEEIEIGDNKAVIKNFLRSYSIELLSQ